MVVRTRARLGSGGTLLKPKPTAGRTAASGPASAPSQLTVAASMLILFGHNISMNSLNMVLESVGPGAASGWN